MTDPVIDRGRRVRSASLKDYGSYSLWLDQVRDELDPRLPMAGDTTADVAIVGAGYTGLWTAYYLLKAEPTLDIVIVERDIAGFGESGRNGGWCSALFAASYDKIAKHHGRAAAIALQKAMFDTVDEVGRACQSEGTASQPWSRAAGSTTPEPAIGK